MYWYRLFGCSASGSNVKVRLNDSDLLGTGIEVSLASQLPSWWSCGVVVVVVSDDG